MCGMQYNAVLSEQHLLAVANRIRFVCPVEVFSVVTQRSIHGNRVTDGVRGRDWLLV